MEVTAPAATLNGGSGGDYLTLHAGGTGVSSLVGGDGNDVLAAFLNADATRVVIDGGNDDDTLNFDPTGHNLVAGSSVLGGAGNDTANVTFPGRLPVIDLGGGGNDDLRINVSSSYVNGPPVAAATIPPASRSTR